jgi:hypothetical protein
MRISIKAFLEDLAGLDAGDQLIVASDRGDVESPRGTETHSLLDC